MTENGRPRISSEAFRWFSAHMAPGAIRGAQTALFDTRIVRGAISGVLSKQTGSILTERAGEHITAHAESTKPTSISITVSIARSIVERPRIRQQPCDGSEGLEIRTIGRERSAIDGAHTAIAERIVTSILDCALLLSVSPLVVVGSGVPTRIGH